jgi:hypothetical protein
MGNSKSTRKTSDHRKTKEKSRGHEKREHGNEDDDSEGLYQLFLPAGIIRAEVTMIHSKMYTSDILLGG